MAKRILVGAAAAIMAASASFAALAPGAPRVEAAVLDPFVASVVAPGVHLLSTPEDYFGPAIGNVTLIEQSDGLVVIDSGLTAANGRSVVAYARSVSSKPIKAIAITHWHNDHPQGVSAIRDAFPGVRVIATAATESGMLGPEANTVGFAPDPRFDEMLAKLLEDSKANMQKALADPAVAADRKARLRKALLQYDRFASSYKGTYIVPPTETFERELLIGDPTTPVRLMHLGRANTDGDLIAWLPRQKIAVSGDIVVAPSPFGFGSYPGDWIETLNRLKALGFTTLIPGHGAPQSDAAYIGKVAAAIADVRAQVAPLARSGLLLDEVRKKVDFTRSIALFGDTPRIKANAQGLFFDPMVANAYKEALGQPIIQGEGSPKPDYVHTPPRPSSKKHKS